MREFALGLAAHGFRRGDKLAVIGDNRPRLYWAQLAAQCLGGVAVPMYQDAIASEMVYVLNHAEIRVVVAEDQEQVDKILSLRTRLPHLDLVVYDDPRGMRHYPAPALEAFERVQAAGREFGAAQPGYLDREIDRGTADDVALLTYTSGTTGHPKGVMLSHANLLAAAEGFVAAEDIRPTDDILCYLPMAWIGESLFSLVLTLLVGFTCNCPERPETVQRDLRELGPTVALAPPRIWENMLTQLRVRAADASPLKRRTFELFRGLAERAESRARTPGARFRRCSVSPWRSARCWSTGRCATSSASRRARWVYTGGAPLGADTYRFFRSFGINLKQVWGSTELSGLASLQRDGEADPDTVGPAIPGAEIRIADDGEVLVRSAAVFSGYYKEPEATRAAVDAEGWFRTGDCGFLDRRGHLVVVDRASDVGKLADGTPFAPQFVENKLKFSPYIAEAVAFGDAPAVCRGDHRDRSRHRRQLGRAAQPRLYLVPGSERQARDSPADRRGDRALQRRAAGRGADPPLSAAQQGIRRRRQRDHPHPQGAPPLHRRKIRRRDRGVLRRRRRRSSWSTEITYEDGRKGALAARIAIDAVAGPAAAAGEPAFA